MSSNEPISMRELIYAVRDTIVAVTVQFETETGLKQTRGNGILIKGHYILCPANLVLGLPPAAPPPRRILIGISGVTEIDPVTSTKSHKAYIYEAELIGGDYRGNLAILILNLAHPWNRNNPPLDAHPTLSWGKSRNASPGDPALIIGDINVQPSLLLGSWGNRWGPWEGSENGVLSTTVSDNRYVSYDGTIPGELLLMAANQPVAAGAAVIGRDGRLLGMVVPSTSPRVLALSEFFMRHPVRCLIRSFIEGTIPLRYQNQIHFEQGQYRFEKSWIGLSGILVTPDDYYTSLTVHSDGTFSKALLSSSEVETEGGKESLELSSPKEIVGYRITRIAGDASIGSWSTGVSPLGSILSVGDLVTHLNKCPLGDRWGQIAPSLIMWRVPPRTEVTLQYRRQAEGFAVSHTVSILTLPYPSWDDFPWYAVGVRWPIQPDAILL